MTIHRSPPALILAATGLLWLAPASGAVAEPAAPGRPLLIQDSDIAKPGPPPHDGLGSSIGFPFSTVAGTQHLYFSKRVLKPGATVGRHPMDVNEVYYLVSGEADLVDDVGVRPVKAGVAMFMKPGQTIELRQRGAADAVLIVASATP
jgi:hypothetical protein